MMITDKGGRPPAESRGEIVKKFFGNRRVRRIEQHRFFVSEQIGIVRYAFRQRKYVFKQREPPVVGTQPYDVFRNVSDIVHNSNS